MATTSTRSLCSAMPVASTHRAQSMTMRAQYKPSFSSRLSFQGTALRPYSPGRRQSLGKFILKAQWGADVVFSDAAILETGKASDNLHRILLDIGSAASEYKTPGQFIQAKIQPDGKAGFFALASAPDSNNGGVVELLIKPQGEAAEAICGASEGATVKVSSVMGKGFPIDRVKPDTFKKLYLFATGSGISPIKALIESGLLEADSREHTRLFYGARNPEAMAYKDRFAAWESEFGVQIVPVYSQQGQGYVQDVFQKEGLLKNGSEGVAAVLCGQKGMAEAITEALTSAGVSKEHVLMNF